MASSIKPPNSDLHPVLGTPLDLEPADRRELIYLAAGCFWGVERIFWELPGVVATAAGYMGGSATAPSYVQVCTGTTGHAEAVRVVYDPSQVSTSDLVAVFFENHDPTTQDRQGNDVGTQYRSSIWTTSDLQYEIAAAVRDAYQLVLNQGGYGRITTQIHPPPPPVFYFAEDYHQAYLHKNPNGYCNHGFNGVGCPRGLDV